MKDEKDSFERGYLIAVSNLINMFGQGTEAEDLLAALGVTQYRIRQLNLTEYDQKPLLKVQRLLDEQKKYWKAA